MKKKLLMSLLCRQRLCLSAILLFATVSFAQSSKINWDRMNRDLEIMQGVLNNLLSPSRPALTFSNGGARGLYFDGYGVVFQIELGGAHVMDRVRFRMQNDFEHAKEMAVQAKRLPGKAKAVPAPPLPDDGPVIIDGGSGAVLMKEHLTTEKQIELLQDHALVFLRDYADAIGQIKPTDRITILANFEHQSGVFAVFLGDENNIEESPSGLNITAKKSDIVNFRKGKIDEKTFRDRITFEKRMDSNRTNRNIDIMANILNTALTRKVREHLGSDHGKRGIYLEGLGALFFIKTGLFQERDMVTYEHYLAKYLAEQEELRASGAKSKGRQKNPEKELRKSIDSFKDELIELVGDYGHTLRTIKPTEHVVINVDFNNNWEFRFAKTPGHLVLRVQKQDLDRYGTGALSLAALRKKVDIQEF